MKKTSRNRWLILAFGGGLILICGLVFGNIAWGLSLDRSSRAFAEGTVRDLVSGGSVDEVLSNTIAELKGVDAQKSFGELRDRCVRNGAFQEIVSSQGEAAMFSGGVFTTRITAQYYVTVRQEKGDSVFRVRLIRRSGRWLIAGLTVRASG